MKRKLIFIFIIMSMILIPSYQVEAKTLRQLQEEKKILIKERDYFKKMYLESNNFFF